MTQVRQLHRPKGWFHSVTTHDAASLERDGQPFYDIQELKSESQSVFEVLFADGIWMLADPDDLRWTVHP